MTESATPKKIVTTDHDTPASRVKVYTKTGDTGLSSFYNGQRKPKNHAIFEVLGNIDEVSSSIGLVASLLEHGSDNKDGKHDFSLLLKRFEIIQCVLQDLCSHVATPRPTDVPNGEDEDSDDELDGSKLILPFANGPENCAELESWIDEYHSTLPKLTKFILPSGAISSSQLHVARCICRRAERSLVPLIPQIEKPAYEYLNRLSDFLFVVARYISHVLGIEEKIYLRRTK